MTKNKMLFASKFLAYTAVALFTLYLPTKAFSLSFSEPSVELVFTLFKFITVFVFVFNFFINIALNQDNHYMSLSSFILNVLSKIFALLIIVFSVKIFLVSNEDNLATMLSYEKDGFTAIFVITSITLLSFYLISDIYRVINRIFMKTEDIAMGANRSMAKFSSSPLSEKDIDITAAHEAGHLMAIHRLSDLLNNVSVSIGQEYSSLGRVRYSYVKPEKLYQKDVIESEMLISLAGCVAEEIVFNTATTGSVSDIEKWELYARDYLINYSDEYFYATPTTEREVEHNNLLLIKLRNLHKESVLNYLKNNIDLYHEIYSEIKEKHTIEHDRIISYFKRIDTPLIVSKISK